MVFQIGYNPGDWREVKTERVFLTTKGGMKKCIANALNHTTT